VTNGKTLREATLLHCLHHQLRQAKLTSREESATTTAYVPVRAVRWIPSASDPDKTKTLAEDISGERQCVACLSLPGYSAP
jgi:hypothetical protein